MRLHTIDAHHGLSEAGKEDQYIVFTNLGLSIGKHELRYMACRH